jgi:hypothetical protein
MWARIMAHRDHMPSSRLPLPTRKRCTGAAELRQPGELRNCRAAPCWGTWCMDITSFLREQIETAIGTVAFGTPGRIFEGSQERQ